MSEQADNKFFNKEKIMPNWAKMKKMANAFGRAVNGPGATEKGRELVFESNTVKNRPGDVAYHDEDTPAQRAFKSGMREGEEEYHIAKDAARERYNGEDPDVRREVMDDEFERREDIVTDNQLENEFDDAFKSNINRRKEKVRGGFGDEPADMFEEQLWQAIDELKANGHSGNEILDMLRVDKPKGPYGE